MQSNSLFPPFRFPALESSSRLDGINPRNGEYGSLAKAIGLSNCHMSSLASKRMRAYVEIPAQLAQAKTPIDLFAAQQVFWQQCARDYVQTTQALNEIWSVVNPITGIEETFEDESLQSCPKSGGQRDKLHIDADRAGKSDGGVKEAA